MNHFSSEDPRWGDYIPWFLRNKNYQASGNYLLFFDRLGQRLDRYFLYESGISNPYHFGDMLETESFQNFRYERSKNLNHQIRDYFSARTIKNECFERVRKDPIVEKAQKTLDNLRGVRNLILFGKGIENRENELKKTEAKYNTAELQVKTAIKERTDSVYSSIFIERLSVTEALLRILPDSSWLDRLIADIRHFFAEAQVMLDLKGIPPLIIPIEEPLLQAAVIEDLLPRLAERFPERAKELIQAYHDVRTGKDLDSIFSEAFKSLEELARSLTENKNFLFDEKNLMKSFSKLHPTIHNTLRAYP